jgi:hypothetical protein
VTGADVPGTLGPSGADALGAAFDSTQIGSPSSIRRNASCG